MPKITIDIELCKGCKFCVDVCPKDAVRIGETINAKGYLAAEAVDSSKCTGCKLCATMCPESAIEVYV